MTNVDAAIGLQNISKAFGATLAIDDLSLTVDEGVFLTLLGPSGCGKSTLLRIVGGFVAPDSGAVRVKGRDITTEPAYRRPVNVVFQDYALFPHMTVSQNIGFGCEMKGMHPDALTRRCTEMLDLIRLPELGNRMPDQLSGGQRQRVALARALAPDPVSLLLDEPLGALDRKLRQQMQIELKAIQKETGKTFVFVTHDQDEAMAMSDLVAVMRHGRIEQLGTPRAIYARPATAFVAGFVGAANMLDARMIASDDNEVELSVGATRCRLPSSRVASRQTIAPGDEALVVIRPERSSVGTMDESNALTLSGSVEDMTFLGGRMHISVRTSQGTQILVEAPPSVADTLSDTLTVSWGSDDIVVVAKDTTL